MSHTTVGKIAGEAVGSGPLASPDAANDKDLVLDVMNDDEYESERQSELEEAGLAHMHRLAEGLARVAVGDARGRRVILGRMRELGVPAASVRACVVREVAEMALADANDSATSSAESGPRQLRRMHLVQLCVGWRRVCEWS